MLRALRLLSVPAGAARMNCLAGMICLSAIAILFLNFQATPAGAGASTTKLLAEIQASSVSSLETAKPAGGARAAIESSRLALEYHIAQLELGRHKLRACPDYTATFLKQERIEGSLLELQTMEMKLRHEPLSVRLKWVEGGDIGRQVVYVHGQNEGKMYVRLGGKKQVLPAVLIDPSGSLALAETRHPIFEAGMLHLIDKIIEFRQRDLKRGNGVRWELVHDQKFADRNCDRMVVEYASPSVQPTYRKSMIWVDKELSMPVCMRNFGWPQGTIAADKLDDETMIEFYGYTNVSLQQQLSDQDFEKPKRDRSVIR